MARFATKNVPSVRTSPSSLGVNPLPIATHEGGLGYKSQNAHIEMFSTCVNSMLSDTFYEKADARITRIKAMVPQCDPEWLQSFIPWLRNEIGLRSVSIVLAAEYAHTWQNARNVVSSCMSRADEPGEFISYWISQFGRSMGGGVKRGVADAVTRLYSEHSLLRYDGNSKVWRFGDVIEFVHPTPKDARQDFLFKFALDRRRHVVSANPEYLPRVAKTLAMEEVPQNLRTTALMSQFLADDDVVFSHERAAGWLGRSLTGSDWDALIPTMGYLALLRNLNNFDRSGIANLSRTYVQDRLADAEAVAKSKVLPFQFATAYASMESDKWKNTLNEAAKLAMDNVPWFPGKTLIMVDRSGSMSTNVSGSRSYLNCSQAASYIASIFATRCEDYDVYAYDDSITQVPMLRHGATLGGTVNPAFSPRGGTRTWACTAKAYRGHDRVLIITDEQSSDRDGHPSLAMTPVITWNIAGYQAHHSAHNGVNRFLVSGFNDQALKVLPHVLNGLNKWPWE